jgi:hypothetical protein
MKMLGAAGDMYTIVITGSRMILARLTQEKLNAAIAEANARAKAEGKGFFSIIADQLAVSFGYGRRYEMMPPEVALVETPGNVALENARITGIKLTLIETHNPVWTGMSSTGSLIHRPAGSSTSLPKTTGSPPCSRPRRVTG